MTLVKRCAETDAGREKKDSAWHIWLILWVEVATSIFTRKTIDETTRILDEQMPVAIIQLGYTRPVRGSWEGDFRDTRARYPLRRPILSRCKQWLTHVNPWDRTIE